MDPRQGVNAEQVVNQFGEKELADLIYEFGEERRSRRIARAIVRARPITTTAELARVVSGCAPPMKRERGRHVIHPATRTFQALRIYVNGELDELKALLEFAPRVLKPGGRLVVISFHSLEDRLVKDAFREGAQTGTYEVLTRKPLTAEQDEMDRNPRSRSAKLRVGVGKEVTVSYQLSVLSLRQLRFAEDPGLGAGSQKIGPGSSYRNTTAKVTKYDTTQDHSSYIATQARS